MKTVAVITATRAEFGLLNPIIKELRKLEQSDFFQVNLIVTGTHLSDEYGKTISEIEEDKIRIDKTISIPVKSNSAKDISHNQAVALETFTQEFLEEKYDAIVILGDRYEMLAIAIAAANTKTPIMHIAGGDTTEGAIDEWIRHSITKMSCYHFVTNELSKKRVIQLGECPDRVFDFGSTSIDNIMNLDLLPKQEALSQIGLDDCKYAVCTYHPVTMSNVSVETMIQELFKAIREYSCIEFIVTKSNSDCGGHLINKYLTEYSEEMDNVHLFSSLGTKRYLSLAKHSEFVIGNSSSGIVETPSLGIPTINIGDRQKGRLQAENVINCDYGSDSIIKAIDNALAPQFIERCRKCVSPYGNGTAAVRIADAIYRIVIDSRIDLKKSFYMIGD